MEIITCTEMKIIIGEMLGIVFVNLHTTDFHNKTFTVLLRNILKIDRNLL